MKEFPISSIFPFSLAVTLRANTLNDACAGGSMNGAGQVKSTVMLRGRSRACLAQPDLL